jgi:hypothetical protein
MFRPQDILIIAFQPFLAYKKGVSTVNGNFSLSVTGDMIGRIAFFIELNLRL